MKKEVNLGKIFNDKVLFILPILMCLAFFSYYFNESYYLYIRGSFEVLFIEVIIWSLIYSVIVCILHLILRKRISSTRLFLLKILILTIFFNGLSYARYVIIPACLVGIFFKDNVNKFISYFVGYMIFCLFVINFVPATFKVFMFTINTKSSDITKNIVVENYEEGPNIYWIHCDGMVSLSTAEKYFDVDASSLRNYFAENDYYTNEDATVVAAHHTMQSLAALYNPYYYDEFLEEHLYTLEETYYDKNAKASYYVDYYDLRDRRLDNELFSGLDKAGYKIATITEFNQYSSFYADYIYDYNISDYKNMTAISSSKRSLYFYDSSKNSIDMINNAIALEHFKTLGAYSLLGKAMIDTKILNYDILDYDSSDYSNYEAIDNTSYWRAKAIIKGLEHLDKQTDEKKFVFVDFSINHAPWLYDENGKVTYDFFGGKKSLSSTYTHSMKLLEDMLNYIKDNDPNAIIILQGDHGIHYIPGYSPDDIYEFFGADEEGVRLLRNSTMNAIYIPEEYRTEEDYVLSNPLNISRYLINNYVGNNYEYRE